MLLSGRIRKMKRRIKLKISTKNKSYDIIDSPFYKMRSKRKLASLLGVDVGDLSTLKKMKAIILFLNSYLKTESHVRYKNH